MTINDGFSATKSYLLERISTTAYSSLNFEGVLGEGAFGKVYLVIHRATDEVDPETPSSSRQMHDAVPFGQLAAKQLFICTADQLLNLQAEAENLAKLRPVR